MSLPENPMVITAALLFDGRLERDALISLLEKRLLPHRRFRCKVIETRFGLGTPRWLDDPAFDVRAHVDQVGLAEPRDDRALEKLVGDLASTPLPMHRPLWHMHLVDARDCTALVVRVHHCVADGLALIAILAGLSDEVAPDHAGHEETRSRGHLMRARRLLGGVAGAGRLLLGQSDAKNPLHGHLGTRKRVACSPALHLDALLAQAHASDATVTDLLLATVAGALHSWLVSRNHDEPMAVHALVPVSLRPGAASEDGNRFASVFVGLPVAVADPRERLRAIHGELRRRRSGGAGSGARLVGAAGAATAAIERLGVALFSRKASVTVSSVRGPGQRIHLAGLPVEDVIAWAPTAGGISVGVTLTSYAGRVRIAVGVDAGLIGDPREITDGIVRELAGESGAFAPGVRA
jgi:diacylglycerol O-acyltransferase